MLHTLYWHTWTVWSGLSQHICEATPWTVTSGTCHACARSTVRHRMSCKRVPGYGCTLRKRKCMKYLANLLLGLVCKVSKLHVVAPMHCLCTHINVIQQGFGGIVCETIRPICVH